MNKTLPTDKKIPIPDKALADFAATLHGKVMNHIKHCLENKSHFEAYIFAWALIDQILIVELITFVAKKLKVNAPKSLWTSNQQSVNNFYLAISQDEKLYNDLEKGRRNRNKLIHELVKSFKNGTVDKETKTAIEHVFLKIVEPIFKRLSGEIPVPSLSLYAKGWNDYRKETLKIIQELKKIKVANTA